MTGQYLRIHLCRFATFSESKKIKEGESYKATVRKLSIKLRKIVASLKNLVIMCSCASLKASDNGLKWAKVYAKFFGSCDKHLGGCHAAQVQ